MFHKEGYKIITITTIIVGTLMLLIHHFLSPGVLNASLSILVLIGYVLVLQFFRNPKRKTVLNDQTFIAPADGKIVIIKEVFEKEYFQDNRIQVSIFMSPVNVHVTRYGMSGKVAFSKYHPGEYLVAWHPKSSEKNERTTIVLENKKFGKVLYRQIAGALARRIVNYAKEGMEVVQGKDAGFIKFGSRIDVFLPLDAIIEVKLNQKVRGGEQVIARASNS